MRLTITLEDDSILSVNVDSSETVENLKALIEVEAGIPLAEQVVLFNGQELKNNTKLNDAKVCEDDLLVVARQRQRAPAAAAAASAPAPAVPNDLLANLTRGLQSALQARGGGGNSGGVGGAVGGIGGGFHAPMPAQPAPRVPDPEQFRQYILSDESLLQQLLQNNPQLADAVLNGNTQVISQHLMNQARQRQQHDQLRRQLEMQLLQDPYNVDLQRRIEEEIAQEQIDANMENAIEHNPESFGRVVMLYVDSEVNGQAVKAFVDSGAQSTIMSASCAKRCGIFRFVDKRFAGIAKGVGTAKILGRVHLTQIKLGKSYFPVSITVLEDPSMEFLLGLDMLRRHQCQIDLRDTVLRIGSEAIPFLAEKDLPAHLRDSAAAEHDELRRSGELQVHPPVLRSSSSNNSSASPHQSNAPQQSPSPASAPNEAAVRQLMEMGYPRETVVRALEVCNGNVEQAASFLLQGSLLDEEDVTVMSAPDPKRSKRLD